MAIYQYYLAVIPQKGVEIKHDFIPNEIRVSTESGFFESDAEVYWNEVKTESEAIISKIDMIVPRSTWGNDATNISWKIETDEVDNDAAIFLDESLIITEFSFRADLREPNLGFLKNMIALGKEMQWLFMDRNGKLMKPDFDEIKISILNSSAYNFLKDPLDFIKNIDENKTKWK